MAKTKRGLGKGLGALMPNMADYEKENSPAAAGLINLIEVDKIHKNPNQPRKQFDPVALEELKSSIEKRGLIQPITVRQTPGGYELISGERRLRSIRDLKMKEVPAYVIEVENDAVMLELAIIENVQRENLNPIEIANGYQRLLEEYDYTQDQVSERVGKKRSTVTNMLRLLKLPVTLQDFLREGTLAPGHAKVLLSLENHDQMLDAASKIIERHLNVRDTEKLVKSMQNKGQEAPAKEIISNDVKAVLNQKADNLQHLFGTKVRILPKNNDSGKIELDFYSKDDFQRIIEMLEAASPTNN
jgi:ParB family transcriptional regulator, chromosome partitioning protein